jgi:prepilin signal peptidase PulO-like enzyme (type II secretory pathway)
MPNMVNSLEPRQTLLEQKIAALGVDGTHRLCTVLVTGVVGVASIVAQTPAARADPVFTAQAAAVALGAATAPLLVHHELDLRRPVVALCTTLFCALALFPMTLTFLYHVLWAHTQIAEPQWYDALWRIYAVLGIWIMFAVVNEAKIRPYFRARALRRKAVGDVPAAVPNTVAARGDAMRRAARTEKLTALRESLLAAKSRRDTAKAAVEGAAATAATAKRNITGAAKLVEAAEEKLKKIGKGEDGYEAAVLELDTMVALRDGAEAHEKGLDAQKAAHQLMLEEATERIKDLDEKWGYWSNLDNYPFYR